MAVKAKKRMAQVRGTLGKALLPENALSNAEGVDAFSRILRSNIPQVLVSVNGLNESIDQDRNGTHFRLVESVTKNSRYERPDLKSEYSKPSNKTEEALVAIWENLLGFGKLGIHDNFFDLGGDSLVGARMISRVHEEFQVDIPLMVLFERPTIAEMAAAIARDQTELSQEKATCGLITRQELAVVITEHQGKQLDEQKLDRLLTELESISEEEALRLWFDQSTRARTDD
jgi:acyl carrier protein